MPKQLELLRELVPTTDVIGFLVNPNNGVVRLDTSNMREAAQAKGVQLQIAEARNTTEIDAAFRSLVERRVSALIVQVDPFFDGRREQLAALAARHRMPAMSAYPEFPGAGGLISYGNSRADAYRLEGSYAEAELLDAVTGTRNSVLGLAESLRQKWTGRLPVSSRPLLRTLASKARHAAHSSDAFHTRSTSTQWPMRSCTWRDSWSTAPSSLAVAALTSNFAVEQTAARMRSLAAAHPGVSWIS